VDKIITHTDDTWDIANFMIWSEIR